MTRFPKTVDSQFIIRVINNEVNQEEKEFFETWLHESEENKEEFGSLSLLWDKFGNARVPPPPNPELNFEELTKTINTEYSTSNIDEKFKKVSPKSSLKVNVNKTILNRNDYGWLIRAASIIIIFLALGYVYQNRIVHSKQKLSPQVVEKPIFYTVVAAKGEKKTIVLSDGSVIYLNVDSKITYPKRFAANSREVELIGEAYFSIQADKIRPFKVISGNTVTVVTGTEFNILNRDNLIRIVVTKGSVEAYRKHSDKGVSLKRGEMTTFSEIKGFTNPTKASVDHFLAWRRGQFSFSHTPLSKVMEEISRYYNIPVYFERPELKSKTITGKFDSNSLENIFSIISLTLDVKINHSGDKVLIQQ